MTMTSCCRLVLLVLAVLWSVQGGETAKNRAKRDGHTKVTVEIDTAYGKVRGIVDQSDDGNEVHTFLGIPYSRKIGRFEKPEEPQDYSGVWDATEHRPRCPHRTIPFDPVIAGQETSEDCLYLDVYAPSAKSSEKLPIMFFLHGGGYYGGSGSLYNFKNVAAKGVVVITVNFRLDVFGFLSTQDDWIPGNFGLLDANKALEWVKNNAPYFGADSDRITGFGGSSGAAMLSIMKMSPLTSYSLNAVIQQSGSALAPWAVHQNTDDWYRPRRLAGELGKALGCDFDMYDYYPYYNTDDLSSCLKYANMDRMMNVSVRMQTEMYADYFGGIIWVPVIENNFGVVPMMPKANLQMNYWNLNRIPTIYGYSAQDGSWLLPEKAAYGVTLGEFMAYLKQGIEIFYPKAEWDERLQRAKEAYIPMYMDENYYNSDDLLKVMVEILTDLSQVVPMVQEARMYDRMRSDDSTSYMYEFNYISSWQRNDPYIPWWYGVGHAAEKGFVLGLPSDTEGFSYPTATDEDQQVADHVVTMWTNFAKYYDPTASLVDDIKWPKFVPYDQNEDERVLYIQPKLEVHSFQRAKKLAAWLDPVEPPVSAAAASRPWTCVLTLMMGVVFLLTFRP